MSKPEITDFAFGHLSTIFSDERQDHSGLQKNELPPQEMAPGHTDEVSTVTKEPPVYSKTKRTKKELPQLIVDCQGGSRDVLLVPQRATVLRLRLDTGEQKLSKDHGQKFLM